MVCTQNAGAAVVAIARLETRPTISAWQLESQPSRSKRWPSSHCSPASRMPLPQIAFEPVLPPELELELDALDPDELLVVPELLELVEDDDDDDDDDDALELELLLPELELALLLDEPEDVVSVLVLEPVPLLAAVVCEPVLELVPVAELPVVLPAPLEPAVDPLQPTTTSAAPARKRVRTRTPSEVRVVTEAPIACHPLIEGPRRNC